MENSTVQMRVIARKTLVTYWQKVPEPKMELEAWFAEVTTAEWSHPGDVKRMYGNASILKGGRVVFNICGNKYRLVVWINYMFKIIYIRFIGTHKAYTAIDAETI